MEKSLSFDDEQKSLEQISPNNINMNSSAQKKRKQIRTKKFNSDIHNMAPMNNLK